MRFRNWREKDKTKTSSGGLVASETTAGLTTGKETGSVTSGMSDTGDISGVVEFWWTNLGRKKKQKEGYTNTEFKLRNKIFI